jgi:hypothetical protein
MTLEHPPFVTRIGDADQLPDTYDNAEHEIVGIHVYQPPVTDVDDDRFAIGFVTASGRCLRVRLPGEHLAALGKLLLELAAERCFAQ